MNYKRFQSNLIQLNVIESTNNYAANLIKATKVVNGTTILTKRQTKGKGQSGNSWQSDNDKNLTFSVIVYPKLEAKKVFFLNIAASLAVRKVLEDLKINAKIKWPNDILVGNRKISGILIENQISGSSVYSSIIGIGLNVNQEKFESDLNATSILIEKKSILVDDIFEQLYAYLDFYIDHLMNRNFDLLKKLYYKYLFRISEQSSFIDDEGEFKGEVIGVNDYGFLEINKENGEIKSYDIKEIKFVL